MALAAVPPVGALAAGGEPGGASSAAEAAAESPGPPTESPGSTGWTPVEGASEGTGEGSPPVQQGSSLGSGGSGGAGSTGSGQTTANSGTAGSTATEPVPSTPEEPAYTAPSGGHVEPESSTSEPASPPPTSKPTRSAAPPPPVEKVVKVEVGSATAVARPPAPRAVDASATSPPPVPVTGTPASETSGGPGVLPLLALIAAALVLVYTAVRLALHVRRRRAERMWEQVCSEREADWEKTLRRIEQGRPVAQELPRQTAATGGGRF
jgi:hypothetical protein